MMPRRLTAAVVASFALLSSPTFAQSDADKATARELAKEGAAALDKNEFTIAADKFERANALFHAPTLVVGLARAQVGLGQLVAAQENYYEVLREPLPPNPPDAFVQAQADAKKELAALSPQVPWVVVSIRGLRDRKDAKVTLDGAPFPNAAIGVKRAIDPGKHKLRVKAKGFKWVDMEFTAFVSSVETVEVKLEPAPDDYDAAPDAASDGQRDEGSRGGIPHQRTIGVVSLSVGGASLIAGGLTGLFAISKRFDLVEKGCASGVCPPGAATESDLSTYKLLGNISTGTLAGGGALIVAGTVLLLTAPPPAPRSDAARGLWITPVVGPGSLGLFGRF